MQHFLKHLLSVKMHRPRSEGPQHFPDGPPAHSETGSLPGGRAHPRREYNSFFSSALVI